MMRTKIKTTTVATVCNRLVEYGLYDFAKPLKVCYRMPDPDLHDGLFGYCHIIKKMSGFAVASDDGDIYCLSDEVMLWQFQKEKGVEDPYLVVWIPVDWTHC